MAGELEVRIDPKDFSRLVRDIRDFDPKLANATRRRLRDAAKPAVADVQRRLMGRTFKTDAGLARGLAAGTKVSIRTAKRGGGIAITTTTAGFKGADREAKAAMVRAYNKRSFRHPVFKREGRPEVWVRQNGRPYFGTVLYEKKAAMQDAMEKALQDAAATVKAATVND